ncbi:pentatricopeptide repeat-containing protein At1g11290, chloroplastic-like isoform X2 [Selaginella moellendorffii]|uniref:pentatricopeptide repeat-containing protein At1g11290, chloroplastic-like isoform X2 n=1 Tax=Selaginella moellendorffii TaxID=88036 RepID=UPI000D1CD252|nr:pentatricopeptide repeat-containing protein At1g11290, chloroplastic-like isoform X2 [Selaginella moellendorffii]|eukprot:XP_024521011.1 pentatricopeptide repeat-containing protein At1g11290, chloroplastic-like isoform X2 [Selaginella moellendorffii]
MLAVSDAKNINPWPDGGKSLEAVSFDYSRLLRRCGNDRALVEGRKIHALIAAAHSSVDSRRLGRDIVEMYIKCGSLIEARSAFQELCSSSDDVALWTAMVAAFSHHGQFDESFRTFQSMLQSGVSIDKITLLTVFNACTKAVALEEGRRVRGYSDECGLSAATAVATAIVNFYGKCRELDNAIAVFDEIEEARNVVTWTVMVAAYVQAGHHKEAFCCLRRMQLEGISPNEFTFVNALGSCGCGDDLARGRTLHGWISEGDMESNPVVANALVSMYSRCGGVEEAAKVFAGVRSGTRDVIMWTSMVAAYGQCAFSDAAFRLFQKMLLEGIRPDKISFITILGSLLRDRAKLVHDLVRECCFDTDVAVGTALVEMFSRAGNLSSAWDAFDSISHPVVASWSALISAMVEHGYYSVAFVVFQRMLLEGVTADKIALIAILGACKSSSFLPAGKLVHNFISSSGFELDLVVRNALIDMYGSCRDLKTARDIFGQLVPYEDAVSWNSMIAACAESGQHNDAILLFYQMQLQGKRTSASQQNS